MTIEHDANGMPVAVSREYAARRALIDSAAQFPVLPLARLYYFRTSTGGYLWTGETPFNAVIFSAVLNATEDPIRILSWRDHRGEGKK